MRAIHTRGLISSKARETFEGTGFGGEVDLPSIIAYAESKAEGMLTDGEIADAVRTIAEEYAEREYVIVESESPLGYSVYRKSESEIKSLHKTEFRRDLRINWQVYGSYLICAILVGCAVYCNLIAPGSINDLTRRASLLYATSGFALCAMHYLVNGLVGGTIGRRGRLPNEVHPTYPLLVQYVRNESKNSPSVPV